MVEVNCSVAVFCAESVTVMLKLAAPVAVGFPLSTPAAVRVNPPGSDDPLFTAHVYPVSDPPVAASVFVYANPT